MNKEIKKKLNRVEAVQKWFSDQIDFADRYQQYEAGEAYRRSLIKFNDYIAGYELEDTDV